MKNKLLIMLSVSALLSVNSTALLHAEENDTYTVGICQYVQHEALDLATEGFKAALTDALGDRVSFEEGNAQGDSSTCTLIINDLITKEVDLILANATTALQAAVTGTADIPILGTSVTEYGAALQIDDFAGTVGGNVSGTSDLAPLEVQAAMIKELFPDAASVGLLYCSAEPNSLYQINVVKKELEALGYTPLVYTFADSYDITSVTMKAASECEVIYVPTDNMVASNAELIANVCIPEQIPVIAGEENSCKVCGAATFSIDYYDLGYVTGEMAVRILTEGEDISTMPIEYADVFTRQYNPEICSALGIEVPADYEPLEME